MIRALLIFSILLMGSAFIYLIAQERGEEDVPASCDNFKNTAEEHKCACGKAMHTDCDKEAPSVMNDRKCRTTCKPDRCRYINKCTT